MKMGANCPARLTVDNVAWGMAVVREGSQWVCGSARGH